jgi:hypothetical protein
MLPWPAGEATQTLSSTAVEDYGSVAIFFLLHFFLAFSEVV